RVELAVRARDRALVRGDDVQPGAERFADVRECGLAGARVERGHLDEDVRWYRRDRRRHAEGEIGTGEDRREVDAAVVDDGTMTFRRERGDCERGARRED